MATLSLFEGTRMRLNLSILFLTTLLFATGCGPLEKSNRDSGSAEDSDAEEDNYDSATPAIPVTGSYLTYDNARVRCSFSASGSDNRYESFCAMVAHFGNHESLATGKPRGLKVDWADPVAYHGKISDVNCTHTISKLQQRCSLTADSTTAELRFDVKLTQEQEKIEKGYLTLPFSVGVAAGFSPGMFQFAEVELGTQSKPVEQTYGFTRTRFPLDGSTLNSYSVCSSKLGTFYARHRGIYRQPAGKNYLELYAGLGNDTEPGDSTSRLDIQFLGKDSDRLIFRCKETGLLVADQSRIFDIPHAKSAAVKLIHQSTGFIINMKQDGNGGFYYAQSNAIKHVDGKGQLKVITDLKGTQSLTYFPSGGTGSIARYKISQSPYAAPLVVLADSRLLFAANQKVFLVHHKQITHIAGSTVAPSGPVKSILDKRFDGIEDLFATEDGGFLLSDQKGKVWKVSRNLKEIHLYATVHDATKLTQNGNIKIRLGKHADGFLIGSNYTSKHVVKITGGSSQFLAGHSPINFIKNDFDSLRSVVRNAQYIWPTSTGELYIADRDASQIRKISTPDAKGQTKIQRVVGLTEEEQQNRVDSSTPPNDDGLHPLETSLSTPYAVAVDEDGVFGRSGSIYVADYGNKRIKVITADGEQGGNLATYILPQGATKPVPANFYPNANSLKFGPDGSLYYSDYLRHSIFRIKSDGLLEKVAGTGYRGFKGDYVPGSTVSNNGNPLRAEFKNPSDIAFGPDGSMYIADYLNKRIRRIDPTTNRITTFMGGGAIVPTSDYNGDFLNIRLAGPTRIVISSKGTMFLVERFAGQYQNYKATEESYISIIENLPGSTGSKAGLAPKLSRLFGNRNQTICGIGRFVTKSHDASNIREKMAASLSSICQGKAFVAVGIHDRCDRGGKTVTLAFSQRHKITNTTENKSGESDNIIQLRWPCGVL